ncbi:MAG: hypothetical protein QOH95_1814, partial [Gaiellaceae bacterium]|nr:hypothetical protein [Gaiellaceae bacterium]
DVAGFVVLTHGTDVRRIPFWFLVSAPKLAPARLAIAKAGLYKGTTKGAPSRVSIYRYPTGGDVQYAGPERSYRIHVSGAPANVGAVVLSGTAVPHVVFAGQEDHLAGYSALPIDLNPYRATYGRTTRSAGVILPAAGSYDVVFDTRSAGAAGPFTFRYWVNDVTPPKLRVVASARGQIRITATDSGSGVDPSSVAAALDGHNVATRTASGAIVIRATRGRHKLVVHVSDYQEAKNMENVPPILPNTATLSVTVSVL